MGEFTPGPWSTIEYGYEKHSITDDRGTEIGFAHRRHDARLIAAAPELYEALSELRDWAQATAPHGVCGPPLGCITCGFVAKADAALAKASAPNPMQENANKRLLSPTERARIDRIASRLAIPSEPTEEMIEAGLRERDKGDHGSDAELIAAVYKAMIERISNGVSA